MRNADLSLLLASVLLVFVAAPSSFADDAGRPAQHVWKPLPIPASGVRPVPPTQSFAEIIYRHERWRNGQGLVARDHSHRARLARIGAVSTPDAFAYLDRLARRADGPGERAAAVEAMGNAAFAAFEPRVAKRALEDRDASVRAAALVALHRMGALDRVSTYASALGRESDPEALAAAANGLAWAGSPSAREVLHAAFMRPRRSVVQHHAYLALTRYEAEPPSKALVLLAGRSDSIPLRAAALGDATLLGFQHAKGLALASVGDALRHEVLREPVFRALEGLDEGPAVAALVLLAPKLEPGLRARLDAHLPTLRSSSSVAALGRALRSADVEVRRLAARTLAVVPNGVASADIARRLGREADRATLLALLGGVRGSAFEGRGRPVVLLSRDGATPAIRRAALDAMARIGVGDGSVRAEFVRRLADRDPNVRVMTLAAAASTGDPHAAEILAMGLDDDDPVVREAAVAGFRTVRVTSAVPRLIDVLEHDEDEVVREAAAGALYVITGQNLYDVVAIWRAWWAEHGATFEVPSVVPKAPDARPRGRTATTFYGLPITADRVIFVLDKSGSMQGPHDGRRRRSRASRAPSKLDRAVAETLAVISRLGDKSKIDVVLFDGGVRSWRGHLTRMNRGARLALKSYLEQQAPSGGTNLHGALVEALETRGVEAIYVLSDGMPSAGEITDMDAILEDIELENRRRRVRIHAVALGHESHLLRRLAAQHRGTYVRR